MVVIQGLGGIPEPKSERTERARDSRGASAASANSNAEAANGDGVLISSEAQAAAQVAQIIANATGVTEVRTERVEAARQNLDRGDYRSPEVVRAVAERVAKFLE